MTDNEIKKALECCTTNTHNCLECPYKDFGQCEFQVMQDAFDLINRQKAEVEKLEKVEHFADKTIATLQAENEKLNTFSEIKKEEIVKIIARAKSEAYKEFDERLKEDCLSYPLEEDDTTMLVNIDSYNNLLKELVGEDK